MSLQNSSYDAPDPKQISAGTHMFVFVVFIGFFAFVVWASIGRLDIVSNAEGEVVPVSQVKEIQHLEGGIVRKIMVKEGDRVVAGQELVALESVGTKSDLDELKYRLLDQRVKIIRLQAELSNANALTFPADIIKEAADPIKRSSELFFSRKRRRESQMQAQEEVVIQRKHEITEVLERLKTNRVVEKLYQEQISISQKLLQQDLANRMQHITLLIEKSRLQGKISEDKQALKRIQASIKEAEEKKKTIWNAFQEEAQKELIAVEGDKKDLTQQLRKFEDSFRRTVLLAPVDGVVKSLYVVTIGGVVPPGGTLLDIVPGKDHLIIEAKLQTQDVGFVKPGQKTTIRLASADAARLGVIEGHVAKISPDTHLNQEGIAFYKILVKTDKHYFEQQGIKYPLVPGMQVICSIITGDRTVLNFLLEPLLGSMETALQER